MFEQQVSTMAMQSN